MLHTAANLTVMGSDLYGMHYVPGRQGVTVLETNGYLIAATFDVLPELGPGSNIISVPVVLVRH